MQNNSSASNLRKPRGLVVVHIAVILVSIIIAVVLVRNYFTTIHYTNSENVVNPLFWLFAFLFYSPIWLSYVVSVLLFFRKPFVRRVAQIYWMLFFVMYATILSDFWLVIPFCFYCFGGIWYFQKSKIKHYYSGLSANEIVVKESIAAQTSSQQANGLATKPTGLIIIQIVTLVSSLIIGFYGVGFLGLAVAFGGLRNLPVLLLVSLPCVFALAGLVIGASFKSGRRWVWFASCIYWVILCAILLLVDIEFGGLAGGFTPLLIALLLFCCVWLVLYLQKREIKEYFTVSSAQMKRATSLTRSVLVGILVAMAVLLLLIQVLGVPFWFAVGVNDSDTFFVYAQPQNPKLGDNVTLHISSSYGQRNTVEGYANNFSDAVVTIEPAGMKPYTVNSNETGYASFVYEAEPTTYRVTEGGHQSSYYSIPESPHKWEINSSVAIISAVSVGLLAGFLTFRSKRFSSGNQTNPTNALVC